MIQIQERHSSMELISVNIESEWTQPKGNEIEAGTFGENLTVSELESAHVNVGDRLTRRNLAGGIFFI